MTSVLPLGKPWFRKKKFIVLAVFVLLAVIGQFTSRRESAPAPAPFVITAYSFQDNIFYDEEQKLWAWTPMFKVNLDPFTKVVCDVKALDKDGNLLVAANFLGNVLKDGSVIYYGSKRYDTTTKKIAKAIKSYEIGCKK